MKIFRSVTAPSKRCFKLRQVFQGVGTIRFQSPVSISKWCQNVAKIVSNCEIATVPIVFMLLPFHLEFGISI